MITGIHIVLFGLLHERYNQAQGKDETSLKEFDQYLKQQSGVVLKTWVHKNKKGNTTYETLSTFVRNKIDHPEAKSPTGKVYEFSEEEMNIIRQMNVMDTGTRDYTSLPYVTRLINQKAL